MTSKPMLPHELLDWAKFIHEICGIHLDATKSYLVESRLYRMLAECKASTWSELLSIVKRDTSQQLRLAVINAITTNETSFFRDAAPFEVMRHKLIPELIDRRQREGHRIIPIRILSAACSTGQEVYSTAIVLKELLGSFNGFQILIQGLDISDVAVRQASSGHFSQLEIDRGLPASSFTKYFAKSGTGWKIQDDLRTITSCRRANLLESLHGMSPFDIILCRNVAIYFHETERRRLFTNLADILATEGNLIIGSTESISSLCPDFEQHRHLRATFYTRRVSGRPGLPSISIHPHSAQHTTTYTQRGLSHPKATERIL